MPVILQNLEIHFRKHSICRVGGDHRDLTLLYGFVEQAEIHRLRRTLPAQTVRFLERRQAIRALFKLVADAEHPRLRGFGCVRQGFQAPCPRLRSIYHHREAVVDAERIQPLGLKLLKILCPHARQNAGWVVVDGILQNRSKRSSRVFRVEIDLTAYESLMRQERATQIQAALHSPMEPVLQMLRDQLTQHHLFGEVLRSDADRGLRPWRRATSERQQKDYAGESFRSSHPNPPSARSAITAAGIAPARICAVSTEATPRKMNTPSPPPPMAAAMVAVPIVVTVATRIPTMMVCAARGICTCRKSCPSVIPMATADSHTAASTFMIPTKVLRKMGSRAYKTSATITVRLPIPPMNGMGIRKPNSARLGMVCMMLAKPSSHRRAPGCLVNAMPSGTPSRTATARALATSSRCSPVSFTMSLARSERMG